jgi:hypothetical protein
VIGCVLRLKGQHMRRAIAEYRNGRKRNQRADNNDDLE